MVKYTGGWFLGPVALGSLGPACALDERLLGDVSSRG